MLGAVLGTGDTNGEDTQDSCLEGSREQKYGLGRGKRVRAGLSLRTTYYM